MTGELLQCIPLFFHNFRHYSGTQIRKMFVCRGITILSIEKCLFADGKNPLKTGVRYTITHYQMPRLATFCTDLHCYTYSAVGLPWQTNNIFITRKFLLQCRDLPRFAPLFAFFILYTYHLGIYRIGKTGQNVALCTTQL